MSINETAFVDVAARRFPLAFQATSKMSADPWLKVLIKSPVETDQMLSCPPRDDPPARDAFAVVLRRLTAEIFSGDLPRDVRRFSPGLQMDYIGRAVRQLVRENYLQLVVFPDFEAAVAGRGGAHRHAS